MSSSSCLASHSLAERCVEPEFFWRSEWSSADLTRPVGVSSGVFATFGSAHFLGVFGESRGESLRVNSTSHSDADGEDEPGGESPFPLLAGDAFEAIAFTVTVLIVLADSRCCFLQCRRHRCRIPTIKRAYTPRPPVTAQMRTTNWLP